MKPDFVIPMYPAERGGSPEAMRKLFDPRSIAVVGATRDARRIGGIALDHLVNFGYAGRIFPINPKYDEVFGLPCFPDIESLPETPDLVVLAVAAAGVLATLQRCHAKGVQAAIVYASGFAEESEAGAELQRELVRFAHESGMVVSGPNCMGHANLRTRAITAFATLFKDYPPPPADARAEDVGGGKRYAAVVTQSGNLCAMLYALGRDRGVQFKHFINTGNEACVEFSEYLSYLADDPETQTVIGYIEGLRDGARFVDAARRFRQKGKALIVIKVGDTEKGAQAALSHTAALAGNQAIYDAAFRQLGVMRARDPSHLVDIAYLAQFGSRSAGPRVAVASISGAMGALLTDLLVAGGLDVPTLPPAMQAEMKASAPTIGMLANPIDLTAQIFDRAGVATAVIGALCETDAVDVVVLYATGFLLDRIAEETIAVARSTGRLIVAIDSGRATSRDALERAGIPVFTDVARCTAALSTYLRWRGTVQSEALPARSATRDEPNAAQPAALASGDLDEHQTKQWLAGHGLPVSEESVATTADEAVRRALQVSAPMAVKILSPDIPHKTEAGGVRLGVQGESQIREAFAAVCEGARASHPSARINGVLLQPMERGVCELIVGVTRDPIFGLAMTVGLGGIFTELFRDVTHRLLPVDATKAAEMLRELRGYPLMTGFRGKPAADIDAACRAIAAVSDAAMALGPACSDLEVNPLLVRATGQGAVALDALLLTSVAPQQTTPDRGAP